MRRYGVLLIAVWLSFVLLLSACGGESVVVVTRVVTETVVEEVEVEFEVTKIVDGEVVVETIIEEVIVEVEVPVDRASDVLDSSASDDIIVDSSTANNSNRQTGRLIIKDGEMELEIDDADAAAEEVIRLADDFGGYVISQRIWTGERGFRYADIEVAVPVEDFEAALTAYRTLGTVLDESATGEDVTDEFVDLNSRLENLYATQERLRTFLDASTTVSETLRVHDELKEVEEEINVIQGRMNFLADRAAFSTISVYLRPFVPTPTPSPTNTPTPTLTPSPTSTPTATPLPPTPDVWSPGHTAERASVELQNTAQSTLDFVIYNSIVCGPWLLVLLLFGLLFSTVFRRRTRRAAAWIRDRFTRQSEHTLPAEEE